MRDLEERIDNRPVPLVLQPAAHGRAFRQAAGDLFASFVLPAQHAATQGAPSAQAKAERARSRQMLALDEPLGQRILELQRDRPRQPMSIGEITSSRRVPGWYIRQPVVADLAAVDHAI